MEGINKYRFGGEEKDDTLNLDVKKVGEFIESILENKAEKWLKSEPEPEDNDNEDPVNILVGTSFDRIARDPSKDAFIMFYAPWD
jgi:hypothetical protein